MRKYLAPAVALLVAIVILAVLGVLSGCTKPVMAPHQCPDKKGRHVMVDGATGWTSTNAWTSDSVEFTPENMSAGRYQYTLTVPCGRVTITNPRGVE